jgi:hypothetical protein
MNLLPDIPPKTFTLSACVVGFLLLDDLTAEEQNALGNWLMLVAQVLCTNGFYRQLQDKHHQQNLTNDDIINMINKMKKALSKELDELNKSQ